MAFFEIGPAWQDLVSHLRVWNEMRRTVENSERRVTESVLQRIRLDEEFGMGKALCVAHAGSPSADTAAPFIILSSLPSRRKPRVVALTCTAPPTR
jgi:hypothetical protein